MDNKLSELKVKIPADKKSRESVAAGYVTDNNSGGYFVIECQECGAVYPSQQADGGGQIADTGDYNDAICPHCGEEGPEECDNVGLTWNVQQAKIIALLAELEASQLALKSVTELWNEQRQRIADLEAIATEYAGKFQKAQDAAKHLVIMNDSAQAEIAHLKTLLATPVRLPRPACVYADHSHPAYSRKQVEEIIATAGLRFTVEGDEQ